MDTPVEKKTEEDIPTLAANGIEGASTQGPVRERKPCPANDKHEWQRAFGFIGHKEFDSCLHALFASAIFLMHIIPPL